ncbi:MAG TPA: ankyrin repeat domain-containing protein [Thermoguttaceae bacterium]|nr:ankyrin repeat domain-containing protein [Thermoguttaceae bacterium]
MLHTSVLTVLAFLAVQGANPNAADDRVSWAPIELAVEKGNTVEVKRLLAIDPTSVKMTFGHEGTLLHMAVNLGHKETAQLLLAQGADPNATDADGHTPLHVAAYFGHLEIVKMLVDKGASVSAGKDRGCTPLHVAVRNGWVEIAAWLIEHGSPLDVENQRGQSELHFANNHPRSAAMVKLLAAKGAKVNHRDRDGYSPLHFSLDVEAAAALLAAGADPNARDKRGNTPLYAAIVTRQLAMVELLLDNGAEANALITPGRSALDVGAGFPDVARSCSSNAGQ